MKTKKNAGLALIGLVCVCVCVYGGLYTYNAWNQTDESDLLLVNIEALAQNESGGNYRYPNKEGEAQFCKLYIYKKAGIVVSVSDEENKEYDASAEYTKEIKEGLKDRCPNKGEGCNPFSCQEVPY